MMKYEPFTDPFAEEPYPFARSTERAQRGKVPQQPIRLSCAATVADFLTSEH